MWMDRETCDCVCLNKHSNGSWENFCVSLNRHLNGAWERYLCMSKHTYEWIISTVDEGAIRDSAFLLRRSFRPTRHDGWLVQIQRYDAALKGVWLTSWSFALQWTLTRIFIVVWWYILQRGFYCDVMMNPLVDSRCSLVAACKDLLTFRWTCIFRLGDIVVVKSA